VARDALLEAPEQDFHADLTRESGQCRGDGPLTSELMTSLNVFSMAGSTGPGTAGATAGGCPFGGAAATASSLTSE
jgi:hypothetical protein